MEESIWIERYYLNGRPFEVCSPHRQARFETNGTEQWDSLWPPDPHHRVHNRILPSQELNRGTSLNGQAIRLRL